MTDQEVYIEAVSKRLQAAEAANARNSAALHKLIELMQQRLGYLDAEELATMMKESEEEAVRVSLLLASQPAPPMPIFSTTETEQEHDFNGNIVDDQQGSTSWIVDDGQSSAGGEMPLTLTDAEAIEVNAYTCH